MPEIQGRREAGFTLMEVVIVSALIAVLSSVAILSLAYYIPNLHLKSSAQDINIQIQKARLEGVRRGKHIGVRFFANGISGTQKFSPIIWVDDNYDFTNPAHPLLESGEEILFKMPVAEFAVNKWEVTENNNVRFNPDRDGNGVDDADPDGVSFANNNFVLNSRGISNKTGSVYLVNSRGKTRQVMVTLGGAVRVF